MIVFRIIGPLLRKRFNSATEPLVIVQRIGALHWCKIITNHISVSQIWNYTFKII